MKPSLKRGIHQAVIGDVVETVRDGVDRESSRAVDQAVEKVVYRNAYRFLDQIVLDSLGWAVVTTQAQQYVLETVGSVQREAMP